MNLRQSSKLALLISAAFSAYVINYSIELRSLMIQKLEEQQIALNDFQEWKQEYEKLIPLNEKWENSFNSFEDIRDLLKLHKFLGNIPPSDPEAMLVSKIEEIKHQDIHIGAYSVCVGSFSSEGYEFTADSFNVLLDDLKRLSARPDIKMGSITLSITAQNLNSTGHVKIKDMLKAKAVVDPLCMIFKGIK